MPKMSCARCGVAGADLSKAGRLLDDDNTQIGLITQPLAGPRFEHLVERVHALGVRPLAELLAEIAKATGRPGLIADRLQAYAGLDPEIIRAVGADRFPPNVFGVGR